MAQFNRITMETSSTFGGYLRGSNIVVGYNHGNDHAFLAAQPTYTTSSIPTIKYDHYLVLILGQCRDGFNINQDILLFDLESMHQTKLATKLPISLGFGGAVNYGKDKAYLFPIQNGSIWELDLYGMSFKIVPHTLLPKFRRYPSIMTDGRWIFVVANFNMSGTFPDEEGFFKIDSVARSVDFVHVENWPVYEEAPNCVYAGKVDGIY